MIESGYVCATSSGIDVLREVHMTPWLRVHSVPQVGRILQSRRVRPATVVLALFFLMPVAVLAQGSPFDTGFTAIQSLFTGTIAKVASLVAIVIGGATASRTANLEQKRRWRVLPPELVSPFSP
jgi:type IV secretory pathway VirB2 component (pilin)